MEIIYGLEASVKLKEAMKKKIVALAKSETLKSANPIGRHVKIQLIRRQGGQIDPLLIARAHNFFLMAKKLGYE